jgi:hypothetical protein
LTSGEWAIGVSNLPAFGHIPPTLNLHRDEFGGAFAVADDGLRQFDANFPSLLQRNKRDLSLMAGYSTPD